MTRSLMVTAAAGFLLGGCVWFGDPEKEPFESPVLPDLSPAQGFGYRIAEFAVAAGEEVQD